MPFRSLLLPLGAIVAESTEANTFDGEFPWPGGTFELGIEFGLYDVDGELLIEELDASGNVLASTTTRLRSSPLILNHHLLDSEFVVAVDYSFFGTNNDAFLAAFEDELGADFEAAPGGQVGQDVWMQDEIEFTTGTLPDGRRMDAVIDSIRVGGLDPYPEERWQGEQFGVARFGRGRASTFDSFGDQGLRNLNDDIQADDLDPILDQLIAELNLTPDEIILFPGIFEEPRGCGRSVAALIPGMVNLLSTNFGGQDKLFMADPFLREDLRDQASDPLIAYVRGLMPATTEVVFVDDWEVYHMGLGEVHCGSNTVRTPAGDWWTDDPGGHQ